MNDFVPTDLVCRARQQPLTPEEQRRLDSLLSSSASVRLAHALLSHLDHESEVQRGDDALIARAAELASGTRAQRRRRRPRAVLLAVACVCVSFGAFAGWQSQWPQRVARWAASHTEVDSSPLHPQRPTKSPRAQFKPSDSNTSADGAAALASALPAVPINEPLQQRRPAAKRDDAWQSPIANGGSERTETESTGMRNEPSLADDAATAARVFAEANSARRAGRIDEAIAGYHRVLRQFPNVREARPSQLALAKLQSEVAPAEALVHYQRLLQSPGPLRPEALFGTVQVARRLGRTDIAQRAVDELLTSYPSSPYAEALRRRVSE